MNVARLGADEDADAGPCPSSLPQFVLRHGHGLCLTVDVDGDAPFAAAVDDAVALKTIPVRRKGLAPASKMNPGFAASPDFVVANKIVRITVAEGHSVV